jgi:hypothetical protein
MPPAAKVGKSARQSRGRGKGKGETSNDSGPGTTKTYNNQKCKFVPVRDIVVNTNIILQLGG